MQVLISLLRGINMTGHNTIRMKDLSALYRGLGLTDVETFIQSGNVIFSCSEKNQPDEVSLSLQKAILQNFGYNIPVMIRNVPEMRRIIAANPFMKEEEFDQARSAVIFLNEFPSEKAIPKLNDVDAAPDRFFISGKEIYIYCPGGFGKTKLYSTYFEKKLGIPATARNWKTVNSLCQIAENR